MSKFLKTQGKSRLAIAVCLRCSTKVAHSDLQIDPDTQMRVCAGCVDQPDPYRLPPRVPDRITLPFVQADSPIDALPTAPEES